MFNKSNFAAQHIPIISYLKTCKTGNIKFQPVSVSIIPLEITNTTFSVTRLYFTISVFTSKNVTGSHIRVSFILLLLVFMKIKRGLPLNEYLYSDTAEAERRH